MRRFVLNRDEDVTGSSGTGIVAEGVVFTDGTTVLRWLTQHTSTAIYDSADELILIHGHDGSTQVQWIDAATVDEWKDPFTYGQVGAKWKDS
jgi:hypothetical protein